LDIVLEFTATTIPEGIALFFIIYSCVTGINYSLKASIEKNFRFDVNLKLN
jgi:hypothetical protein